MTLFCYIDVNTCYMIYSYQEVVENEKQYKLMLGNHTLTLDNKTS